MIPRAKLEDIDEAVIQQLIDDEFREGRTLDFKDRLDLSRDGKQALAEDVCAFANTVGGDLVFGLTAPDGTAGEIRPVEVESLDDELQRLTNFLRDSTEPRVTTALLSRAVPLASGGHVVVLRVYPSPNAPHRVIRNGQFYLRNSVGKEPMDIHAIRTAFAHAEGLAERARAFRDDRLARRRSGDGPVPLVSGQPRLVIHIVPVLSLTRHDAHTIEELKTAAARLQRAQPAGYRLGRPVTNYEGVICISTDRDDEHQHYAFAQLFRDGCIEIVSTLSTEDLGNPALPTVFPARHEQSLVWHDLPAAFQALTALSIPAPLYLSVSVLRVRGLRVAITRPNRLLGFPVLPARLMETVSPLIYVDDLGVDPAVMVGPALDVLWNAVGIDHTQTNFDEGRE